MFRSKGWTKMVWRAVWIGGLGACYSAQRCSLAPSNLQRKNFLAIQEQQQRTLEMNETSSPEQPALRLQLGHAAWAARDYAAARVEYARLVAQPDVPAPYRSVAQLRIAQSYVQEKNYQAAQAEFQKLLTMPEVPEHHRWETQERQREIERLKAGRPPRDPTWSRVRLPPRPAPGAKFYVAPDGADTNPGTRQRPFATLERAREVIRALKRRGKLPTGGIAVYLKPGNYRRKEAFQLSAEDSGTEQSPIVYRAERRGTARLTGGVQLTGFQPVTDPAILGQLPEEARGKVLQLDLKAQGITDFGELRPRGFGCPPSPAVELFFNGKPMTLARWPNEGFVHTGPVVEPGSPDRGAVFEYAGDRPARWLQARDPWLFGYWRWQWADGTLPVAAIDPTAQQIRTARSSVYGLASGMPYYAFNLLEEIDVPAEWYLDRNTGLLYFYPPSDPDQATVQLSLLSSPLVQMDQVSYVVLQGLLLELGRFDGVTMSGGDHCRVEDCLLRQLGGTGVVINGGHYHGVLSCEMHTLGRGGTSVVGGDRKTLTPGGHFVENCHIHDFSRIDRTYTPAVFLDGVGNRVAHNEFHHSPCHALRIEGNDHVIEFNEVHHVVLESDDQGGLDMFGNPSYRGNILRYNFWHDIGTLSPTPCGQAGIRLDDAISGTLVYGNVFYRCSSVLFGGVQIHGGKENIVDNNLFIDCQYGISFSPWGEERWKAFLASEGVVKLLTQDIDIASPPYSTRYPALAHLTENPDVNRIWRNVAYRCGEFLTRDRGIQELVDNYITAEDPGFVDAEHLNFQLKPEAPVFDHTGFRPIPFEEIGRYR